MEADGEAATGREPEDLPPEQRPGAEHERRISGERRQAREEDPELARRFRTYQEELGLSEEDADLLTGDRALAELFDDALEAGPGPRPVANWVIHELRARVDDEHTTDGLPFGGRELGRLVALVEEGVVSQPAGREVLEILLREGGDPAEIVESEGLGAIADREDLGRVVEEVLAEHPKEAGRLRDGEEKLLGFFLGRVMRATDGRADPGLARELLRKALEG